MPEDGINVWLNLNKSQVMIFQKLLQAHREMEEIHFCRDDLLSYGQSTQLLKRRNASWHCIEDYSSHLVSTKEKGLLLCAVFTQNSYVHCNYIHTTYVKCKT